MHTGLALPDLGWDGWFESHFQMLAETDLVAARVTAHHRGAYLIWGEEGETWAEVTGKFRHSVDRRSQLPVVGDWVAVRPDAAGTSLISAVLERKSKFSRTGAGQGRTGDPGTKVRTDEQVLAANLDLVFVVTALTEEFNVRRIERYLTTVWEGGAIPVIVLNKADLVRDPVEMRNRAAATAPGVDVFAVSALRHDGLDELSLLIAPGKTVALVGSSGVGKTSILNTLITGEERLVHPTRNDDRGRHTTTHRELIRVANGGMIIDTPGLRELALWNASEGIERTFEDVISLALSCRFNDCRHDAEPGCAVKLGVENGELDPHRLLSYQKLKREAQFLERRQDPRLEREARNKWKAISKEAKRKARP